MKKSTFSFIFLIWMMTTLQAQKTISLYEGKVPNSLPYVTKEVWEPQSNGDSIVHFTSEPTLTIFAADKAKANGTAVIICPGGGYWVTSIVKEGFAVAREFNKMGVTAFVLKYRMPNDSSMANKTIGPLQDAQRAIQFVRSHAKDWNLHTDRIGIMGFSAGGHLASTAATHFTHSYIDNADNVSLRPDFSIFIYPVISFQDSIAHMGSREQLIGKNPTRESIDLYSNEMQVTPQSPPTFLVHATDDNVVPVMNSIKFYEALVKNKITAELHVYKAGGHGFGLNNPTTNGKWMILCVQWMESMGWMKP